MLGVKLAITSNETNGDELATGLRGFANEIEGVDLARLVTLDPNSVQQRAAGATIYPLRGLKDKRVGTAEISPVATESTKSTPSVEPRDPRRADTNNTYNLVLDGAEIDTVLAALRLWQRQFAPVAADDGIAEALTHSKDWATYFEGNAPLIQSQIDALCEYINLDA